MRRTKLGQVAAAFWIEDGGITLVSFRSVAAYVFDLLSNAAEQRGRLLDLSAAPHSASATAPPGPSKARNPIPFAAAMRATSAARSASVSPGHGTGPAISPASRSATDSAAKSTSPQLVRLGPVRRLLDPVPHEEPQRIGLRPLKRPDLPREYLIQPTRRAGR